MSKQSTQKAFLFEQSAVDYRLGRLKNSIYRRMTKNALPLFFRGKDTISAQPLMNGAYEPEIKTLIEHYADLGHADFLIDIGANIGLTSCQSGRRFKELHLYEPNPDCYNVLKVNTNIMLTGHNYHIHEYGLGEKSDTLKFCIPHNNWGGAFVASAGNAYSEQTQAEKDGHASFDNSKYTVTEVKIEPATAVLDALFQDLNKRGLRSGVIKIDVEGYELTVLDAIAKAIPADMRAVVIFENWSHEINFSSVLHHLGGRGKLFNMVTEKHPIKFLPRWMNALLLLLGGSIKTVLAPSDAHAHVGGLVLEITPA